MSTGSVAPVCSCAGRPRSRRACLTSVVPLCGGLDFSPRFGRTVTACCSRRRPESSICGEGRADDACSSERGLPTKSSRVLRKTPSPVGSGAQGLSAAQGRAPAVEFCAMRKGQLRFGFRGSGFRVGGSEFRVLELGVPGFGFEPGNLERRTRNPNSELRIRNPEPRSRNLNPDPGTPKPEPEPRTRTRTRNLEPGTRNRRWAIR